MTDWPWQSLPFVTDFLQAYNAFASKNDYEKAVDAGVNAAALYHRENYYKEAFDLLSLNDNVNLSRWLTIIMIKCHVIEMAFNL